MIRAQASLARAHVRHIAAASVVVVEPAYWVAKSMSAAAK